jgi:ubiquinone/menaquinone biosynthesis C-methylase UbiE
VLDIGCGTGISIPEVAKALGTSGMVMGLDFSHTMLTEASTKRLASNAVYIQGDAHLLPIRSESVDAALCFAAFAHFADKKTFLREVYRVLRPSGRIVICHAMSSAELNEFHRGVGDEVGNDILPDIERVADMGRENGFAMDRAIEKPGLYMVALRKPLRTSAHASAQ